MIHDLDILQAVQQKLKERFPYPVYLQEVKEGFAPPAFFLKTMTVATPQKENEVYRDTDLYITYLPKKQEKSTAIYAVLFAAENLFRDGLKVGNRYLPVVSMSEELMGTDNDVFSGRHQGIHNGTEQIRLACFGTASDKYIPSAVDCVQCLPLV